MGRDMTGAQVSRRAAVRAAAAAAAISAALAGCGYQPFQPVKLPESDYVADAPWPRLIDAPAPISATGASSVQSFVSKGQEIQADVSERLAALRQRDAEMRARPVVEGGFAARARALRAAGRRISRAPFN